MAESDWWGRGGLHVQATRPTGPSWVGPNVHSLDGCSCRLMPQKPKAGPAGFWPTEETRQQFEDANQNSNTYSNGRCNARRKYARHCIARVKIRLYLGEGSTIGQGASQVCIARVTLSAPSGCMNHGSDVVKGSKKEATAHKTQETRTRTCDGTLGLLRYPAHSSALWGTCGLRFAGEV